MRSLTGTGAWLVALAAGVELLRLPERDFASCHQLLRAVPQDLPLSRLARRTVELLEDPHTWPPTLITHAQAHRGVHTASAAWAQFPYRWIDGNAVERWGGVAPRPSEQNAVAAALTRRLHLRGVDWRVALIKMGGAAVSTGLSVAGGAMLLATEADGGLDLGLETALRGLVHA